MIKRKWGGGRTKSKLVIITAVLALVIVLISSSYAYFTYSRIGNNTNKITMGNIEFSMLDGESVSLSNAFPESDVDGNLNNPYTFTVNNTSSEGLTLYYDLSILTNNNDSNKKYFKNNQIRYSLIKNGNYVKGSSKRGDLISNLSGFISNSTTGEEVILPYQAIEANTTDTYELRIWIDEDVDYSSNIDENGLMNGTYNEYEYSLKVKVGASSNTPNQVLTFSETILKNNSVITTPATLTTTSTEANENGLYMSTDTNSGDATYFFRGIVENNYVSFANQTWRIVRINEDGTVRLILDEGINDNAEAYMFDGDDRTMEKMYYTNAEIKSTVDTWYNDNLTAFDNYIATSTFCEEMRVAWDTTNYTAGNASFVGRGEYTPTYKCEIDGNGHGELQLKVGLITMEEEMFAGAFVSENNYEYFLHNKGDLCEWTMSPAGVSWNGYVYSWLLDWDSRVDYSTLDDLDAVRPVISLKADVSVTGTGTSTDPYTVIL